MIPILISGGDVDSRRQKALATAALALKVPGDKLANSPDFFMVSPDPSVTIENVREIIRHLSRKPFHYDITVVFVDSLDKATTEAQNALLKTLEEPPASAQLIVSAAAADGLLPTVVSRCLEVSLPRSPVKKDSGTNAKQILGELLEKSGPDVLPLINTLSLPKHELLGLLESLLEEAQKLLVQPGSHQLGQVAFVARKVQILRRHIDANANVRLAVTDFILSL